MDSRIHFVLCSAVTTCVFCLALSSRLSAQVSSNQTISFQGFLTDDVGDTLNTVVPMTFKLHYPSTSGSIWTETHSTVSVVGGKFSVDLGSIAPLDGIDFRRPYELGISVNGDPEMSPRTPLTAVPYAMNLRGALRVQLVDDNVDVFASDNIIGGYGWVDPDAVGVTIAGGGNSDDSDVNNRGYGNYGAISGGYGNYVGGNPFSGSDPADNPFASVGGGRRNEATGAYSTIPGGYYNRANGRHSFAAGYQAQAVHDGAFVWADSTAPFEPFISTGENQFLIRAPGGVGIGTASPTNQLHVVEANNGAASAQNHVALIDNSSDGTSADVLALRVARTTFPETSNAYISFLYNGNSAAGFIRGNGSGSVELVSGGSDYAEYLERLNPGESIAPGDVVAVVNRRVTRAAEKAGRFMVVTDRPAVVGNMPDPDHEDLYEPIAFIGQVPVNVRGPVSSGDFILPSGFADGTARAVAPESVSIDDIDRVVGRAWESASEMGVKKVFVEVGLDLTAVIKGILQSQRASLASQRDRIERLERVVQGLTENQAVSDPNEPSTAP